MCQSVAAKALIAWPWLSGFSATAYTRTLYATERKAKFPGNGFVAQYSRTHIALRHLNIILTLLNSLLTRKTCRRNTPLARQGPSDKAVDTSMMTIAGTTYFYLLAAAPSDGLQSVAGQHCQCPAHVPLLRTLLPPCALCHSYFLFPTRHATLFGDIRSTTEISKPSLAKTSKAAGRRFPSQLRRSRPKDFRLVHILFATSYLQSTIYNLQSTIFYNTRENVCFSRSDWLRQSGSSNLQTGSSNASDLR